MCAMAKSPSQFLLLSEPTYIYYRYPVDPMDFTSNMRYFPRISPNSLEISPKFRANIQIQSLT